MITPCRAPGISLRCRIDEGSFDTKIYHVNVVKDLSRECLDKVMRVGDEKGARSAARELFFVRNWYSREVSVSAQVPSGGG